MSTNNHEVWANSTTPLFLQNPAYSITLAGTPTNVVLTNSNGQLAVNGAIQTATSLWSTFPATSNTIFMDATTSNKITNIGSNLYFAGNLIASAGDISNVGNWSLYNAVSDVNLSNVGSNYSIVGARNITAISNVITPVVIAPNNLSVSATSNLTQFCGITLSNNAPTIASSFSNTYSILGDKGTDYTDFCYTTLSNKGGKGGQINLTADGGQVNIGGTNYGIGGLINITANSPSVFPYNATSAIKLSGASILSYAGAVTPLGSLAGYNYIQGTLGVNIVAGSASSLPNTPGTIYLYGANGTKIQNTLYVDVLNNYTGSNLNIQANNGSQNVNISNTQALYMQNNPLIDGGSGSNRRILNFDRIEGIALRGDTLNAYSGDLTISSDTFSPANYNININSKSNINLNPSNGGTTNISSLKLLGGLNANAFSISNVGSLSMSPGIGYIDILGSAVVASGTSSALVLASNSRLTGQVDLLLEAGGNLNITNLVQATFKTSGSINSFNVGGRNYLDINAPTATSVPGALRLQGNAGGLYFAENLDINMPYSNYITINQYGGTSANSYFQLDSSRNISINAGNNTIIDATSNTYLRALNEITIQTPQGKYITLNQYGGVGENSYIQFDPGKNITMRTGNDVYISAKQDTYVRSDRNARVECLQGNYVYLGQYGGTGSNSFVEINNLKDIALQSYRYLTFIATDPATSLSSTMQFDANGDISTASRRNIALRNPQGQYFVIEQTGGTGSNSSFVIADNGDVVTNSRRNLALTAPTGSVYFGASPTIGTINMTAPTINGFGTLNMNNNVVNNVGSLYVQNGSWTTNGNDVFINANNSDIHLRPIAGSGTGEVTISASQTTLTNTLSMQNNRITNVSTLNGHNLYQYVEGASTASTTLTADTPLAIVWDIGILSAGFTLASGNTTFVASLEGNYAIVCTLILQKSAGSGATGAVYAWIETTGGVQVANSARHIDVPTGETNELTLNQIIPLTDGQSFRIMVASDVSSISLLTIPAQTTPYVRPQSPSGNISVTIIS